MKTEIEWFKCDDKLPEKPCKILVVVDIQPYGEVIQWFPFVCVTEEGLFDGFVHGFPFEDIKYWAYFPILE